MHPGSWYQSEVASRSPESLAESARVAMSALNVPGSRNIMLVIDETVWAPMWDVIVGLRDDPNFAYVGGYMDSVNNEDFTYVARGACELPESKLSKMTMHFCMTRLDTNCHCYMVDMLPRRPAKVSQVSCHGALQTLREFATLIQQTTLSNSGIPPLCASWDGGGSNCLLNALYLGLLPKEVMEDLPFFSECQKRPLRLPHFIYKAIFWNETEFISASNDSWRVMKRYSHHLATGCRIVRMGALAVNLTPMIRAGLSVRALGSEDIQSDADSARRMCASYVPKSWSGFGCIVAQFLNSLIVSGWAASTAFSLRESLHNVLTGYYLLLIMTQEAQASGKSSWKGKFLPPQTIRGMLDLCGHFVLAARHWPEQMPWRPRSREEHCIEGAFGVIKSFSKGSPTIKDGIYGTHHMHAKQLREADVLKPLEALDNLCEKAVTAEELETIASQALEDACIFQA